MDKKVQLNNEEKMDGFLVDRSRQSAMRELKLTLKNDVVFRSVFRRSKKGLQGLLGALLNAPPESIRDIEFLDTHLDQEYPEDKEGILDLRILCQNKRHINIEMQMYHVNYWEDRSLFYNSKLFVSSVRKGEDYRNAKACIHIGILDFTLFPDQREFYSIHKIANVKTGRIYSDKLAFHVVELSKLKQASETERGTDVYRWARLISAGSIQEMKTLAKGDEYMKETVDTFEYFSLDDEERYRAFRREMAIMDRKAEMKDAYEEGMEQGIEQGKQELVLNMLRTGISIEEIASMTNIPANLSVDRIREWDKMADQS